MYSLLLFSYMYLIISLTTSALPTENIDSPKCKDEEFRCPNGRCIKNNVLCDGRKDCNDRSDENASMCKNRTCTENEFRCKSEIGHCIPNEWVCDNWPSCQDQSDEDFIMCQTWTLNTTTTQRPKSTSKPTSGINLTLISKITKTCGRPNIAKTMVLNGDVTSSEKFPWNVAIYKKTDENNNLYSLICGGTLIASNLLVSAAHCFWENGLTSKIITNDGKYKTAVGKYTRDITIIDHDFTAVEDVKSIYIEPDYSHQTGSHAYDIAIVELSNSVTIGENVMPICVDWSKQYTVQNGAIGKVAGWGNTEMTIPSPVLLEASLEFIDRFKCREYYTNAFQKYITTKDKFCARSKSGQMVDLGDSGAGLSFEHKQSHFLTGIVSLKDYWTNDFIAAFTDVSYHIEWIRDIYAHHSNDS